MRERKKRATLWQTLRVWWAIMWRVLFWLLLLTALTEIFGYFMHLPSYQIREMQEDVAFLLIPITLLVIWRVLNRDFGSFQLLVVPKEPKDAGQSNDNTAFTSRQQRRRQKKDTQND